MYKSLKDIYVYYKSRILLRLSHPDSHMDVGDGDHPPASPHLVVETGPGPQCLRLLLSQQQVAITRHGSVLSSGPSQQQKCSPELFSCLSS